MSTARAAAGTDVAASKPLGWWEAALMEAGAPEPSSAEKATWLCWALLELVTGSGTHWPVLAAVPMGDKG